jgi:hypothetical protein
VVAFAEKLVAAATAHDLVREFVEAGGRITGSDGDDDGQDYAYKLNELLH